jgi:molybdopterin-guanine dinucleotide biosynthesis protein A
MIRVDGMLMIGAAGTNAGKTQLACALLRKFGRSHDIAGIKVTTIKENDGQCPRGGEGCGVCSSLQEDFYITQETDKNSEKDTGRLLSAGASRVFWLRVRTEHLQAASTALLRTIGLDAVSICESNSLRHVIEPGLFLMAGHPDLRVWKTSARQVKAWADRIVTAQRGTFDLDLDRMKLMEGKWQLQEKATAVVMAGGSSRRMGTDKSMLPINGRPLVERICQQLRNGFEQVLVSADQVEKFAFLGLEVVPDKVPGQGPLMGIASALAASDNELNFVVACDIPNVKLRSVRRMLSQAAGGDADIVISVSRDGKQEPLFAVYRKTALDAINKVLSSGGRKISDVFSLCKVRYIELEESLINLNTAAEYESFQKEMGNARM